MSYQYISKGKNMNIAITADLHLTSREKHPERFRALENIFDQLVEQEISTLIIAGDLFDATCTTPGEFEDAVKKKKYSKILLYVIPGNHDPIFSEGTFSLPNIRYIVKPELVEMPDGIPFVFIPFKHGSSVGEFLAAGQFPVKSDSWVLVGHGDWLTGTIQKNEYEIGTYMPLSGRDLLLYKPKKVFLGHIHAPIDSPIVHYTGSPCGIDPTETGYRSFIIFDPSTWNVSRSVVDTDLLFFNEQITILPLDEEEAYVRTLLSARVESWKIPPTHRTKVRVRVKARGYSRDRLNLTKAIRDQLREFQFTDSDQPDISQVKVSNDMTQGRITELVKQKIDALDLDPKPGEPDRDDILLAAMNTIYGGK
jgi:DNA repair protein SbcD/Mre11